MAQDWAYLALISAVMHAAAYVVNEHFKLPGQQLVFWNKLVLGCLALPVMLFKTGLPSDLLFYVATFATVPMVVFADGRAWEVAAKQGGGVLSRTMPLMLVFTFLIWLVVKPSTLAGYMDDPANSLGIIAALGGVAFFASRLRKCAVSAGALKLLLPAMLLYAVTQVLNKTAMDSSGLSEGVFAYICLQAFAVAGASFFVQRRNGRNGKGPELKTLFSHNGLKAGLMTGLAALLAMMSKNYGFALVDNPAYVVAMLQSTPVFVTLYYLARKRREQADVKSGFGVVACCAALAVLTA